MVREKMMRNWQKFAMLFIALLCCGCQRTPEKITLHFWAMGREGEVVQQLLPEFERTHPGIHVEVQQLPWTSAHEKLLTAFAGDSTPDLCQLGNTWIPEFAALGALQDLSPNIEQSKLIDANDYFPGIWNSNRVGNALFGVPWYVDTRLLFYRQDLLAQIGMKKPPANWDEWQIALAKIKAKVGNDHFSILLPTNEFEPLLALALQQDNELLRDNGQFGNFRSQQFRTTLAFYLNMFKQHWAPPSGSGQISNVWNEFSRGYFSFYISGPWNIGEFKRRLPADQQGNWMTAPLPGAHGPGDSSAGGSSIAVFANSKHKEAAWQLVEFLSDTTMQAKFNALTGDLPPRRSAWTLANLYADPYAKAFADQLERVKSPPKVPEWERIATEMRLVSEQAVHGDLTLDQAVIELDVRADRILEKRRWMLAHGGKP